MAGPAKPWVHAARDGRSSFPTGWFRRSCRLSRLQWTKSAGRCLTFRIPSPLILRATPPTWYACRARGAHWAESGTESHRFRPLGSWSACRENVSSRQIPDRHLPVRRTRRAGSWGLLEFDEYRLWIALWSYSRRDVVLVPPGRSGTGARQRITPHAVVLQSRRPPFPFWKR